MVLPAEKTTKNRIKNSSNYLFYGLILFFIFEYTRPSLYFSVLNVFKLNSLIPLSLFVFSIFAKTVDNNEILKSKNTKWFLFFLFLLGISVLTGDVTLYAFDALKIVFSYLLVYFVIRKQVIDIAKMKVIFATMVLVHIFFVFMNPDIVLHPEKRSYLTGGTFLGDGNDFALSICIVIPFTIFLFQEASSKILKIVFFVLLLLLILCVIGTQSRGGTLGLLAVSLYQWIKGKKKAKGLIVLFLFAVVFIIYAPEEYFNRMNTIIDYRNEGSAMGRIVSWEAAVRMAADHPLIGVGAGHFPVKFGVEYRPAGYGLNEIPWLTAHSNYFLILGELGFPGIIFLISIIILNFTSIENKIKELNNSISFSSDLTFYRLFISLNSSLIGFAISGAFLSAIYYPHLYILVGLIGSGEYIYSKSTKMINSKNKYNV